MVYLNWSPGRTFTGLWTAESLKIIGLSIIPDILSAKEWNSPMMPTDTRQLCQSPPRGTIEWMACSVCTCVQSIPPFQSSQFHCSIPSFQSTESKHPILHVHKIPDSANLIVIAWVPGIYGSKRGQGLCCHKSLATHAIAAIYPTWLHTHWVHRKYQ